MEWRNVTVARLDNLSLRADVEVMMMPMDLAQQAQALLPLARKARELSVTADDLAEKIIAHDKKKPDFWKEPEKYAQWKNTRTTLYAAYMDAYNERVNWLRDSELTKFGAKVPILDHMTNHMPRGQ
jgi:hypothetical protein